MSYLDWPRLHFKGRFQADTSTVNNDVRHYKSDAFQPQFQAMMVGHGEGGPQRTNGYWNPEGSGAWRLLGCRITSAVLRDRTVTDPRVDPVIGMHIAGSNDRVAGKLVDLDPQQQAVSQIWGLRVALEDERGQRFFDGHYDVGTFTNLWKRQQIPANFDQTLAAVFQSQLSQMAWGEVAASQVLSALKQASDGGRLSICFNAFGFDRDPTAPDYTTGVVAGSIGPASCGEPKHFVLGRKLVAPLVGGNPTVPAHSVYSFTCRVHEEAHVVSADMGNCLPILHADGSLQPIGRLALAVARGDGVAAGNRVGRAALAVVGDVPYLERRWYERTAGVVDLKYDRDPWLREHISERPLVLVRALGEDDFDVLITEAADGLYARADGYVLRLNPGDQEEVTFFGTRFGVPNPMTLLLGPNNDMIGGSGTSATLNPEIWPVPEVGVPADAIGYARSLELDSQGKGVLTVSAASAGPGCPRKYLDGQVYGVGYRIDGVGADYLRNPWNFVSCLLWDAWPVPDAPTWYGDIRPILAQYGNLYPIMSRHLVDLSDYDSVVAHRESLILCFELPVSDPNSMPVSRDLSANKREGILRWLRTSGPDGRPLKGDPKSASVVPAAAVVAAAPVPPPQAGTGLAEPAPDPGGKLDYLMQVLNQQRGQRTRGGGKS